MIKILLATITLLNILYTLLPLALPQQTPQTPLEIRVRSVYITNNNLPYVLSDLSKTYDIPIGLEIYYEENRQPEKNKWLKDTEQLFKPFPKQDKKQYIEDKTIRETLDIIIQVNDNYTWKEVDGVINVYPKNRESILDAAVKHFKADNFNDLQLKQSIVELPTVKAKETALKKQLAFFYHSLGSFKHFSETYNFELHDVQVRDILNHAIKTGKKRFWYIDTLFSNQTFNTNQETYYININYISF